MFWFMVLALGIAAYALTGGASVFKAGTRVLFTVGSPEGQKDSDVWNEFSRLFPGASLVTSVVGGTQIEPLSNGAYLVKWQFGAIFQHDVARGNIAPVFHGSDLTLLSVSSGLPAS